MMGEVLSTNEALTSRTNIFFDRRSLPLSLDLHFELANPKIDLLSALLCDSSVFFQQFFYIFLLLGDLIVSAEAHDWSYSSGHSSGSRFLDETHCLYVG